MINPLSNRQPHESWGGWENFLKSCDVRDEHEGVTHYAYVNCNYILFGDGTLLENFGFHGNNVMNKIREHGADFVLAAIKRS